MRIKTRKSHGCWLHHGRLGGFTLIELMIAMLLGLIVIAGVASVFLANMRSYTTSRAVGTVQTNSRIAFELMARDIRQAGLTGCNSVNGRIANVLRQGTVAAPAAGSTVAWWANWDNAVHGVDSTQPAMATSTRATGTDSLVVLGAAGKSNVIAANNSAAASFTMQDNAAALETGDVVVACNPDHAVILQLSNVAVVQADYAVTPTGNCSIVLGYPSDCLAAGPPVGSVPLANNSRMARLGAHAWYVGTVGGISSLYRASMNKGVVTSVEMVRNVNNMQLSFHVPASNSFISANAVADWNAVNAVRISLELESSDKRAGVDENPITRTFATTVSLRNR